MDSRDDVLKFMVACGQTNHDTEQKDLYMKLIREEFNELRSAYAQNNIVEIADACADLKWVIEGLEHTLRLPNQAVWDEVARSNHAKISSSGVVEKRADGKVLKPEGWTPPDIKRILKEQE
ncbi:Phosphoribosyl-ATP pyrophosphohydrolase-like [uncultured Caudovirales phage]|uniref:Phosphoribosyl-ATP pyrophosphohydrolase-like n=1 Tax=uncultured Caudovirales phage TaxID=2100421 RepID=A0A6J5LIC9_9CAUD|nr:Phosphoribosyl-ATP pyrophosphohydrolase-like [uncultured Caudovirales phage]